MRFVIPKLAALLWLTAAVFSRLGAADPPVPTDDQLSQRLGGRDVLRIIREADRIEGVRVDVVDGPAGKDGSIRRDVVPRGKLFVIDAKLAGRFRALLGDRRSYEVTGKYCSFSPGVRLVFHQEKLGDLEMQVCLGCSELAVFRREKELGRIYFDPAEAEVRQLMIDTFPDNKDIREMVAEEEARLKENEAMVARWTKLMPQSLLPLWDDGNRRSLLSVDLAPHRVALRKEFPNATTCILALLAWYGSGDGPWFSGYPSYEEDAEDLLLDFSTAELLAAIKSATLTEAQTEGAARLFSGRKFGEKRPADRATLPGALKTQLLNQVLKSSDEGNREGGKIAFGGP